MDCRLLKTTRSGLLALAFIAAFLPKAHSAFLTVTSTADSGANTLRQAIADAAGGDTILFALAYPATITLSSSLTIDKSLTLQGPGSSFLTISGNSTVRVFDLTAGTITISQLTVASGQVTGSGQNGAGIRLNNNAVLVMDECLVRDNSLSGGSNQGAAFYVPASATLSVFRSTIHSNTVPMTTGSEGGAFYTQGNLTLMGCTIYNNTAYFGSAISNWGVSGKTATLSDCTISGNVSYIDAAVVHNSTGAMNLTNCTLTANQSSQYEAGLFANAGSVTSRNTVIAGNLPLSGMGDTDIFLDTSGVYGGDSVSFTSYGYNLIGSTGSQTYTWTSGDVVGTESSKQNANLSALADNGGYASTHAPNSGSQVINPASSNSAPFVDGRGYVRTGTADKGACEYGGASPTAIAATGIGQTQFTANWNTVTGASGYLLDVATAADFSVLVPGYARLDVGNVVTYPVSGLSSGTRYYYRIRAYNGIYRSFYSGSITADTATPATATPTPSGTWTPTPTCTVTPTLTSTFTRTATQTHTSAATASSTPSSTPTGSAIPSATPTPTESRTATTTRTASATPSHSATASRTATFTPTSSLSASMTPTPTPTASGTSTATPGGTASVTPSHSATASRTATFTPTSSLPASMTPTPTLTAAGASTATPEPTPVLTATPTNSATCNGLEQVDLDFKNALAYPNPANDRMIFLLHLRQPAAIKIILYNFGGERVAELRQNLPAGAGQTLTWQCRDAANGLYLAVVMFDGVVREVLKVIVVH